MPRADIENRPVSPGLPAGGFSQLELALRLAVAVLVVFSVYIGWRLFWFLTDDAFIAFRYVSNSMLGHGLVWNPAPFRPVEGYTSFLWIVLLKLAWLVTGHQPPQTANWMSLAFGYGTLYVGYRMVERMFLPARFARHRLMILTLVLLGTVTNRTFLCWLSSGLETSMFNFFLTWWIYSCITPKDRRGPMWALSLSLSAACAALTRPDGLLFYAGTIFLLVHDAWSCSGKRTAGLRRLAWAVPLVAVPAHIGYRLLTYGEWLPNTYYAKSVGPWPQSGIRYLLSFVVEYGLWVWIALALVWAVLVIRKRAASAPGKSRGGYGIHVAVILVTGHLAYYTIAIGGDHFEYRVYSHLILLLFVSAVWLLCNITRRVWLIYSVMAFFIICSWPVQWIHWRETRDLNAREQTHVLVQPIAGHFPVPLEIPVGWWDQWQDWLIRRHVCMRHQEHKVFCEEQLRIWPSRQDGSRIKWDERAVLAWYSVGVPAWVLPEVAIIDLFGLSDYVIARSPLTPGKTRRMAHDRKPPEGYVECFRPNMRLVDNKLRYGVRAQPLTDDEIRACEGQEWFP
jgi:arabinofuranosyltransferase